MARARLIDNGFNAWAKRMKILSGLEIAVGITGDNANEDYGGSTMADIAIYNEFGTEHVPERPAHRTTFETRQRLMRKRIGQAVLNVSNGALVNRELKRVGAWYAGELKNEIIGWDTPPNAPATIAKKGDNNPLIDTGRMVNAIIYAVRRANGR